MLFNSIAFAFFFLIVYLFYFILKPKSQNRMLLVASYYFYGMWDYRFLGLLFLSTVINYFAALIISKTKDKSLKNLWLIIGVVSSFGILGFFKYYNFFAENLVQLLYAFGWKGEFLALHIILPVGISFYTFQTMSYTIDVYKGKVVPTRDFLDFALFISFFPQLVAGPIERANDLLPQIQQKRKITYIRLSQGGWLILWGLVKKVVIADNMAKIANPIFAQGAEAPGFLILIGIYAFAFQIYGDFSGYTDMARGIAQLMGFELRINFNKPYLATNPSDFWKRWHISLSTWLKDYIYIPLGGNQRGKLITYRNLLLTMLFGGLWHGAAWTFVVWGAYHGLLLILYQILFSSPTAIFKNIKIPSFVKVVSMFHLTCFGWLLFRAETMEQVLGMVQSLLFNFQWALLGSWLIYSEKTLLVSGGIALLILVYWRNHAFSEKPKWCFLEQPPVARAVYYMGLVTLLLLAGVTQANQFIYFQF